MTGRRGFRRVTALLGGTCIVLAVGIASAYGGAASQGGYLLENHTATAANYLDGDAANIKVTTINPSSNVCLFFSVAVDGWGTGITRQLEEGIVRCGVDVYVDMRQCSTANNIQGFHETANGNTYNCYPHGTPTVGSTYHFSIERDSSTSGTYTAYEGAGDATVYGSWPGLTVGDMGVYAWGEASTPAATVPCSGWTGAGNITSWQRYNFTSGWHTMTGLAQTTHTCWTVGALSAGAFNVTH